MTDHPVKRKLERDVLPYLISARQLRKQWFYRLHTLFGYTTDLVVAFAAIGISSPLVSLLSSVGSAANNGPKPPTLSSALGPLPAVVVGPTTVLIVLWVIMRIAFNREDGQNRAVLARSCAQVLRQAEARLHSVLRLPDPMPALIEMAEQRIGPTVDRSIQDSAWPWVPFAPNIDTVVTEEVAVLCMQYERDWAPVDARGLRRLPSQENSL